MSASLLPVVTPGRQNIQALPHPPEEMPHDVMLPAHYEWLWPVQSKTDWTGKWIWASGEINSRNAYACFRKTFHTATRGSLKIDITADSRYSLFLDGKLLGRGPTRGHLDWLPFDSLEVSLNEGTHVVAILAHHVGEIHATQMTGRPGLLADVQWKAVDRETRILSTGGSWKTSPMDAWLRDLPCLMSHFGFWEECDLRKIPTNWQDPDFDDSAWDEASELSEPTEIPWKHLVPCDLPRPSVTHCKPVSVVAHGTFVSGLVLEDTPAKRQSCAGGWLVGIPTVSIPSKQAAARLRNRSTRPETLPLKGAFTDSKGHWMTFDFGSTVSGYPVIEVEGLGDDLSLDISYDDVVSDDGSVNPERSYARLTDRFRLRNGHNRVSTVSPRGFRYLTVDLWGEGSVRLIDVSAEEELYPFGEAAQFQSSEGALNRLIAPSTRTLRVCATDAFTDCASRERVQWMQDCYLHAQAAAYAFGDTHLLRRALFQGAQNALPDGRINGFMPSERTGCAFVSSSLVWLHLLVDYLLFSGDKTTIRRLLPTACRLLRFISSQSEESGLICHWPAGQFWDWAPLEDSGCLLITNGFYIKTLEHLAKHDIFQSALSHSPDLQAMRSAAHQRFWQEEAGMYCNQRESEFPTFSQHGNALAALSGICPDGSEARKLLRKIIDPTRLNSVPVGEHSLANMPHPPSGTVTPVGTLWFAHFLCEALFNAGMGEEAIMEIHRHWGPFAQEPTFPETRIAGGNTTSCHAWSCGPSVLLPAFILGIRPVGPGWSQAVVAPVTGVSLQAQGFVRTPHGSIHVRWDAMTSHLEVEAPPEIEIQRKPSLS